ncbi:unnamed protein product [Caenorhabditis nigoni]
MLNLTNIFMEHKILQVLISYPVWVIGSTRALLVLVITVDRVFATYFPIAFFNYRKRISSSLVIFVILTYAVPDGLVLFEFCGFPQDTPPNCMSIRCTLGQCYTGYWLRFEQVVGITLVYALFDLSAMFIYCGDTIDVPPGCISIMCALSICYRNYWLSYEKVTYALNIALSGLLSVKLFAMRHKQDRNEELKKANRLVLIDFCILIIFDITSPLIVSYFPGFYPYMGPVNAFFKTVGFVIEGCLVYLNLKKRSERPKTVNVVAFSTTSVHK